MQRDRPRNDRPHGKGSDRRAPPRPGKKPHGPHARAHGPHAKPHGPHKPHAKPPAPRARPALPKPERPPVVIPPSVVVTFPAAAPPRPGEWLLTTRPGAEQDLLDELVLPPFSPAGPLPRLAGPALVAVPSLPKRDRPELAFARQGFPVAAVVAADDPRAPRRLAEALADALPIAQGRAARERGPQPFALDAWVPDDERENVGSAAADALGERVLGAFAAAAPRWSALRAADARAAWSENGLYAQLCVAGGQAYLGVSPARDAPSLAPGGRLRVHLPKHAPSRAARKLLEAFAWLDRAPEPGEVCVDLGAAPGGWSWVLLERGAKVIAVDPARLDPIVTRNRGLTHLRADAFRFEPEGTADWLVADMAWRPLEAAALYGKWARRGWARMLIANIKLPMRKKAEYLARVRDILTSSGWQGVRARQLYHDREEVTVAALRM